uniref:Alpha-2-macroglobulin-like n=1 Tax=Cyprinus carpio TaxID=7962 RepID=A0A8C2B9S5_CYPCA
MCLIFMVTFPGVIRSGSEAKLCVSLLKPEENLQLTISLVNYNQNRTLLQERTEKEFHRCLDFQAPETDSVQEIQVEAQGENTQMIEKRKVKFMSYNPLTIIQTDKQIYNPGQTGIFALYSASLHSDHSLSVQDFHNIFCCINVPVIAMLFVFNAFLYMQDNRINRINQWINATSTHGKILQLSHTLNPEALVGSYEIFVETSKQTITKTIHVKEYVLPKFEVKLLKPKTVRANEEEVKLGVCGRYTHGHPVQGSVKMGLCKTIPFYASQYQTPLCVNRSAVLNETGCVSEMFPMSVFIKRSEMYYREQSLDFTASVTEEGTDISMERTENMILTYTIGSIKLIDLPEFFEKGSVIQAKVKVEFSKGTPFPYFKVVVEHALSRPQELTTDINGLADFTIDTSLAIRTSIYVSARASSNNQFSTPYHFDSARKTLQLKPKESPAKVSQLVIKALEEPLKCEEEISVTVQYTVAGETAESGSVTIVYLVSSREEIVHHGYEIVKVKGSDGVEGEVMFKVPVRARMAPKMEFLVYCVPPSETVLAASRTFQIEKCFENKVSLRFSPTTAVPGEENTLQISAQPGSLCGLSAVDQSVRILEPGKHLDAEKIFKLFPIRLFPIDIEDEEDCFNVRSIRNPRLSLIFLHCHLDKNMGLKVATNLIIRMPSCIKVKDVVYHRTEMCNSKKSVYFSFSLFIYNTPLIPEETIRTFFPETWIWELVEMGDSGSAQVPVTVPDTITSWETEAFCLSSKGLGLAPPAQLTVFQPFFLELSLPYSIIRGEIFELKATVFNYLSKCIMVKVTPAPSSDYTLKASSDDQYSSCLCANERKTFKWILTPSVLGVLNITVSAEAEASQTVCDNEIVSVPERGRIDTVTQSLRVNAEGIEKTNSHSWLLCPKWQNLLEEVDLEFPKNMIEGSGKAAVSVIGDILGRALRNLDGLLQMPYGCGEQNIAVLSPNIYILDNVTITAYITASLLELNTSVTDSAVSKGLSYLKRFVGDNRNTYTTALIAYTFSLAKDKVTRDYLLKKLMDIGISEGSRLHWTQSGSDDSDSLAVEISSYVLLAVLVKDSIKTQIWFAHITLLNRFISQDTVVALQALSLYATKVFSFDGSSTVTVQSAADTHRFDVNQHNKLLYQEKQLQNVPAKYSIEVKGSTCVSVQMSLFYNIPTPKDSKALQIFARTGGLCQSRTGQILDVVLDIMYIGTQDSSNMVIVDVKILSGFKLEPSSLDAVRQFKSASRTKTVHRAESNNDHVIIYLEEVQKNMLIRQTLHIKQIFSVKNLKPAVVKVYDYYETSERSEAEYFNHCA